MSQIVIHESSDFDHTTTDEELKEEMKFRDLYHSVKKMLNTGAEIDERFINMYRVRKAKQSNIEIGFDGIDPNRSQLPEKMLSAQASANPLCQGTTTESLQESGTKLARQMNEAVSTKLTYMT